VTDDDDTRTPLDQAIEVLVYLPVGFVFEVPRSIPRFIDRGRRQVAQACEIGLETLRIGQREPSRHVSRVREHTAATLRGLGVAPPLGDEPVPSRRTATLSVVADPDTETRTETETGTGPAPATGAAGAVARAVPPPARSGPAPDPASLAIPGYDSLSASQVVPRLEGLTGDELETVRTYEQATRGRKTILSKIAQLQAS
jgi:hypothetical protein